MSDHPPLSSLSVTEVLEVIPDIAFIYRDDGILVAMNAACERTFGVPRAQAVGRFDLFANEAVVGTTLMAAYRAAFRGAAQLVPTTEIALAEQTGITVPLNTAVRWVETMLMPLAPRADGTAAYVLGIQRDVTELMRTRQEIEAARVRIDEQQDTIASLEAARRQIESQRATIEALSTPVIEVWDGILTLPLLGHFTSERAGRMTEQLLEAVTRTRARHVILDLTGIAVLDTTTGDHLLRVIAAVGLLGATGVLVGIQADVAQLLVNLGVDLRRVRVHRNLRQALKSCMGER
jgi:anti-anti-sigma regulatory factor